jgi:hypothetical protein
MKRFFTLLTLLCSVTFAQAQLAEPFQFKQTEHDFGKIPQGKPVYYFFEITNTSDKPLKIDNVTAACGCTTPEWSKDEVEPGATTKIKVGFNAAADGYFEKPITVQYNGNVQKTVKIKGIVWKAPAGSAPSNASIQFLKQQIQ